MTEEKKGLDRYLSPVDVWGMAFGCMVGWGVFAMPGNTFLPLAGPAGTLIAMVISMVIILIIGTNFSYLMGRSAITGGVYSYTKEAAATTRSSARGSCVFPTSPSFFSTARRCFMSFGPSFMTRSRTGITTQ